MPDNSIPDNHPLLLKNLLPANQKQQTSDAQYLQSSIRTIDGFGRHGAKHRPFNYHRAISAFGSWAYKATMINAKGVASQRLREYARTDRRAKKSRDFKTRSAWHKAVSSRVEAANKGHDVDNSVLLWETRPVSPQLKRYLNGDARGYARPSKAVMTKTAEMGGDFEEIIEQTPEMKLLSKPNPWMTAFDFPTLLMIYLQLTGNSYIHPVIDPRLGVPCELWMMPPQWTSIIPDREHFIAGYVYGKSSEVERKFQPDEVIHFKQPNPKDLFYGMGNVEAVWDALNLHDAKRIQDTAKFENHGRPDWLLIVKNGASSDALDRLEEAIDSKLRGVRNAGKFLTVTGDVTAQMLNQEIEQIGDSDVIVEEIAAGFDIPITKLKANDPNRANAEAADAAWQRDAILPFCTQNEETLNSGYLPLFKGNGNSLLAYDNPVSEDKVFGVDRLTKYVAGGIMSPNEGRAEEGLPPAAGGNDLRIGRNSVPFARVIDENPLAGNDDDPDGVKKAEEPDPVATVNLTAQQTNDVRNIVSDVTQGLMPRDAGLAILQMTFPITVEQAVQMMGSAGTIVPPVAGAAGGALGGAGAGRAGVAGAAGDQRNATTAEPVEPPDTEKTVKGFGPHKYSCVMAPLTGSVGDAIKSMSAEIPDDDLAEDGRETDPHVTVLYGLHDEDHSGVVAAMAGESPITLSLGKTKVFPADSGRASDVIVASVHSDDLHRLNAKLRKLPHTNKYPTYEPHATVAYVKPGKGQHYANRTVHASPVMVKSLVHAGKSGHRTEIVLSGISGTDEAAPAPNNRRNRQRPAVIGRMGTDGLAGPLPQGTDLQVILQRYFNEQKHAVLSAMEKQPELKKKEDEIPRLSHWFNIRQWTQKLLAEVTPVLESVATDAAKKIADQLVAADDVFSVVDRNLPKSVADLALKFCDATNQTTVLQLDEARDLLRKEIVDGTFAGDTCAELANRVQQVFNVADTKRATMIAQTETSRALHAAELLTAKESGLVQSKSWLASADCCDKCAEYASKGEIPLEEPFGVTSYGEVMSAPAHPNCQCSQLLNLKPSVD